MPRSSRRIHPAALAVTSDGDLLVNVARYDSETDPGRLLRRALRDGGSLFVGVTLSPDESREAKHRLDESAHEGAAHILGRRTHLRRRERSRIK